MQNWIVRSRVKERIQRFLTTQSINDRLKEKIVYSE